MHLPSYSEINRRKAILAILCALAGKRVIGQTRSMSEAVTIPAIALRPPIMVSLDEIHSFQFQRDGETIELNADDIWAALKVGDGDIL